MSWFGNIRPLSHHRSRHQQSAVDETSTSSSTQPTDAGSNFLHRIQRSVGRRRQELVLCFRRNPRSERPPSQAEPIAVDMAEPTTATAVPTPKSHSKPRAEKKVECSICLSTFDQHEHASKIMRACKCKRYVCVDCIRESFVGAARDPTRMPPRCCYIYPIHMALPHISPEEATMYRKRFEEWSAPVKTYCPVPTCSAFIPDRLIQVDVFIDLPSVTTHDEDLSATNTRGEQSSDLPEADAAIANRSMACFRCPDCSYPVCIVCKQGAHPGEPCTGIVAPEMLKQIQRWGYKQCPSCKTGVKKMYGCNHIQCHCGSHWCWGCLQPINACEERDECLREDDEACCGEDCCESEDGEAGEEGANEEGTQEQRHDQAESQAGGQGEAAPAETQEPDLDWRDRDFDGMDFGDEPVDPPSFQAFTCHHEWEQMKASASNQHLASSAAMECHRCWVNIVEAPLTQHKAGSTESRRTRTKSKSTADSKPASINNESRQNSFGPSNDMERAWRCVACGIMVCASCVWAWRMPPRGGSDHTVTNGES